MMFLCVFIWVMAKVAWRRRDDNMQDKIICTVNRPMLSNSFGSFPLVMYVNRSILAKGIITLMDIDAA